MSSPETQALNLTLPRGKHSPELTQGVEARLHSPDVLPRGNAKCGGTANFEEERWKHSVSLH